MDTPTSFIQEMLAQFPLAAYATFGIVAASGAIVRYLWDCLREVTTFSLKGILLYVIFGVFIGNFVGSFLRIDHEYRDGLLLLSGFVVKELLGVLYRYGGSTITKFLRVDVSSSITQQQPKEEEKRKQKRSDTPKT